MKTRFFRLATLGLLFAVAGLGISSSQSGPKADKSATSRPRKPRANAAFLDQCKAIAPHLEWNREVVSRRGGVFTFVITSEGPFSITLVTNRGYRAILSQDRSAFKKEDVLLTADAKGTTYKGKAFVPPGSSWFIIENQTDKTVMMRLQCFAGK